MSRYAKRKTEILSAALELAKTEGLAGVTRAGVAERAEVATGLINAHYGTMNQLRRAIIGEALRVRCLPVLAQAMAMGDPRALGAPEELRRAAALSIVGE